METVETIDSDALIQKIITEPLKPANSIQLQFINNIEVKELFEFCMEFFYKLSMHKFSKNGTINLLEWGENNISLLKKYFNSIGLDINVEKLDSNNERLPYYISNSFKEKKFLANTMLKTVFYLLQIKDSNTVFVLSFDMNYYA